MIFTIMLWGAILFGTMRLLAWIVRNHPRFRNAAAFFIELGAASALAVALLASVAVSKSGGDAAGVFMTAALFSAIAILAHLLAWSAATSPHALWVPFLNVGLFVFARGRASSLTLIIGVVVIVVGLLVGWIKSRRSNPARAGSPQTVARR